MSSISIQFPLCVYAFNFLYSRKYSVAQQAKRLVDENQISAEYSHNDLIPAELLGYT